MMEKILCLFGDAPIDFALRKADFLTAMTERKDQPMVIRGRDVSNANRSTIINDIWSDCNLMALPVILQESNDFTNYGCHFLSIDVAAADFNGNLFEKLKTDFWTGFTANFTRFISRHAAMCRDWLDSEVFNSQNTSDEDSILSLDDLAVIGRCKGIAKIIEEYQNKYPMEHPVDLFPEESFNRIVTALENCSDITCDDSMTLVSFVQTFLAKKQHNEYCIINLQDNSIVSESGGNLAIYTRKGVVYLTRKVMQDLCDIVGVSIPSMCHILQDHGFLTGAAVNKSTPLTRITVNYKPIRVYGLDIDKITEVSYL